MKNTHDIPEITSEVGGSKEIVGNTQSQARDVLERSGFSSNIVQDMNKLNRALVQRAKNMEYKKSTSSRLWGTYDC